LHLYIKKEMGRNTRKNIRIIMRDDI